MRRFLTINLIILDIGSPFFVSAQLDPEIIPTQKEFVASIGETTLNQNHSFLVFDNELEVGLPAGQLAAPAVIQLSKLTETTIPPAGFSAPTAIYQIDMPAAVFKAGRYFVSLKSSNSSFYKKLYFFDKNDPNGWRPLPSNENFGKGLVSTYVTFPFVRLAVFESESIPIKGNASWYRYKNGLFAASPDWPKGSRLRVINTANHKFVDVIVNDYGPDRSKHPDRVIDLDAVAFARLAPLGQGTMSVAVEVLPDHIPSNQNAVTTKTGLNISAKAALILNSADKKVIWSKDETAVVPLASLTKLMAINVFLRTKPDLNKIVTYSVKDEKLNNQYVPANESARLRLQDGDQLSIKDLLYASLISSTNNTVETLVRVSGLSRTNFIARMNQRAKELGALQTSFIEPTGLATKNVTSARDYAIIARDAFLNPLIAAVSVRSSYRLTTVNTNRSFSFQNTNLLAREKDSQLLGSKTGYLTEAGHCLVTKWPTAKGKNIIIILFGDSSRQSSVDDTKTLLTFAQKNIN